MKPDGVTMETTEPTEAATGAEPTSTQDNPMQVAQAQSQEVANNTEATAGAAPEANGKSVAEVKPNVVGNKMHPTAKSAGASVSSPRPGTASHSSANGNKSSNASAAKRTTAGAVPKRPAAGAAAASTVKTHSRVPDKKSAGPARTTSAATVTNGTKAAAANGSLKRRPVPETVNGAKPKTTASASKTVASTAPKPNTSTTFKAAAAPKTRPATVPSMTRPPSTTSRTTTATAKPTTATAKPTTATTKTATTTTKPSPTTTAAKTAASRATTVPSTGRTNTVQLKSAAPAAKKDVSRPPPMAVPKKPAAGSAATKKPDPPKPTAAVKLNSASRLTTTKSADAKVPQLKTQQLAKLTPSKKTEARFLPNNKPLMGGTPPASPANRPAIGSASKTKGAAKPTQTVQPFSATRKMEKMAVSKATSARKNQAAGAAPVAGAVAGAAVASSQTEAESAAAIVQESSPVASAPEEINTAGSIQNETRATREIAQSFEVVSSPPQSPARTAMRQISPIDEHFGIEASLATAQEQSPAFPQLPPVASQPCLSEEMISLSTEQTTNAATLPAATNVALQKTPPTNLNDEEDEEEREGSQLVSVSEMSGTTQPTEESRPGSAGLVAGSAWRAGGALLSELDSEEVSGSQQGASELSAPGVLEGTESMDDLGDGSLKGAIEMEGASAGSPDFEKVPDIPVNDFDENEDEDDSDRVYDMDVGSERTDEPPRPRHDNDVDDDDDDDVEMASEGVTESGLESYGNADEDDFAEDERLDNLNRVVQPPPPPPVLPSAPAAQWDQPNPFANPWAEPLEPVQAGGAAAAGPLVDPWQLDSDTPTQATAQTWLELGSDPSVPKDQQVHHQSAAKDDAQIGFGCSSQALGQTQAPAPLSAPGMSLSSTLSSESSTPEELGDHNRDEKLQPPSEQPQTNFPQPYLDHQDLSLQPEKGEKVEAEEVEPETLPADEVFGGPATAPTSNPSSSSVTEDEASDTEGEAQLDDSLEAPLVCNVTVDMQPPGRCCLSTVEEGEEAETEVVSGAAAEDATPPSATSMASYGFDTTTASNSNAQSTGESCIKSPGIFSLEELPEEAKEPCLIPEPHTQPCLAEQQYIECGKQEVESAEHVGEEASRSKEGSNLPLAQSTLQQMAENPEDVQHPYYSICEKNEDSLAGFPALPLPHRRDHAAYPRTYYDIVKQQAAATPPKLTCADLPPRNLGQQALSPQLRRLEQHQRQLQEMQQRRAQQSRPLEEAEQERKRREEEELRRKKEEAEEEIKRNKLEEERKVKEQEELKQRKDLELQLQQQQEELMQRQQIMQWQQELQQSNKIQTVLLSPSAGLCTIYETLENSDEEETGEEVEGINELKPTKKKIEQKHKMHHFEMSNSCEADEDKCRNSSVSDSPPPPTDSLQSSGNPSQDGDDSSPHPLGSLERPPPLDLDWGKKVDIVQQLINQTLLLNGDGCSSLLLLPGGAGGTLSPLESSLWPSLLPPLTPPSATVTSVSSFSPEATGSSPQGEWTVVELETHH